jgi:hypothetical protein
VFELDGRDAGAYASQGQLRASSSSRIGESPWARDSTASSAVFQASMIADDGDPVSVSRRTHDASARHRPSNEPA